MRIEVLPGLPEALSNTTDRFGSTQVSVVSRLIEWFTEQSDVIQAGVLGLHPEDVKNELPKMIFDRIRAQRSRLKKPSTPSISESKDHDRSTT